MFKWLRKDPLKALQRSYENQLKLARDLQRKGDVQGCSAATAKAEEIAREIDRANSP